MINILEVVTGAFRERFASRDLKINLSLPDSAVVFGDRDRLMQLFNNLLENSLRYTDGGGGLHISGKQENGRFALTFADSARREGCAAGKTVRALLSHRRFTQPRQRGLRPWAGDLRKHCGGAWWHHPRRPFAFGGVSITVELPLERDLSREA